MSGSFNYIFNGIDIIFWIESHVFLQWTWKILYSSIYFSIFIIFSFSLLMCVSVKMIISNPSISLLIFLVCSLLCFVYLPILSHFNTCMLELHCFVPCAVPFWGVFYLYLSGVFLMLLVLILLLSCRDCSCTNIWFDRFYITASDVTNILCNLLVVVSFQSVYSPSVLVEQNQKGRYRASVVTLLFCPSL